MLARRHAATDAINYFQIADHVTRLLAAAHKYPKAAHNTLRVTSAILLDSLTEPADSVHLKDITRMCMTAARTAYTMGLDVRQLAFMGYIAGDAAVSARLLLLLRLLLLVAAPVPPPLSLP